MNNTDQNIRKPKIAIYVTSVYMVRFFLVPHLTALSEHYDVTLILKNDAPEILSNMALPVRIIEVPIERKISILADIKVLLKSIHLFRREKFELVHTMTPKAGLIGIVAAFIARVPRRLHTFQGEVWLNKTGLWRMILKNMDRLVATLATHLLVVSHTERQFLIEQKIIKPAKTSVIGEGSIGGVDLAKFTKAKNSRTEMRANLSLSDNDIVILYVGRLNKDKGLLLLKNAFTNLRSNHPDKSLKLHIVGPDEEHIEQEYNRTLSEDDKTQITFFPYSPTPEDHMAAADIFVLPSAREGFGVVIIEAAAAGIPAVGSDIYGLKDALSDGKTGLLFKLNDVPDLTDKLSTLISDEELRKKLGTAAYQRVTEKFDQKLIIEQFIRYYQNMLGKN